MIAAGIMAGFVGFSGHHENVQAIKFCRACLGIGKHINLSKGGFVTFFGFHKASQG